MLEVEKPFTKDPGEARAHWFLCGTPGPRHRSRYDDLELTWISDLAVRARLGNVAPDMIDSSAIDPVTSLPPPQCSSGLLDWRPTPSCPTLSSKSTRSSDPSLSILGNSADRLLSILLAAVGRLKNPLSGRSGRAPPWETFYTSSPRTSYILAVPGYVWSVYSLVGYMTRLSAEHLHVSEDIPPAHSN